MKYVITENQNLFIRRINMIDEFLMEALDVVGQDICDYTYPDYIQEIVWQLIDRENELHLPPSEYKNLEKFLLDNYKKLIKYTYVKGINKCEDDWN